LTKIIGKRSRHSMLASTPASILNHKTSKNGIPADSTKSGYALTGSTSRAGPKFLFYQRQPGAVAVGSFGARLGGLR
ncbi:hypothetical protein, partial [Rhizobium laguerreae]|uniref:hypothetical protein n=1 Tax=Rhizobium laguerreae TaxID=1076926 RepID=UPI001C921985